MNDKDFEEMMEPFRLAYIKARNDLRGAAKEYATNPYDRSELDLERAASAFITTELQFIVASCNLKRSSSLPE